MSFNLFNGDKDDLISTVFSELKSFGVKVPKYKRFKTNLLKLENSTSDTSNKIFGVNLGAQEWISNGDTLLPKFIALSTAYLQNFTDKEIGLFRKAGNVARQKKLRARLEKGDSLEDSEPNDVACLLKQWLRELPEPLIPSCLQELFIRCLLLEEEDHRITAFLLICLLLLPGNLYTLKHLLCFLAVIASNSDKNKMDSYNLALIMAPNIFAPHEPPDKINNNYFQQHSAIMKILIDNCEKIGEIPTNVSFQHFIHCSELDSSSDLLDGESNKSKKKVKTGPVQDIFSGFKRLVGQNGTPIQKSGTPDNFLKNSSGFSFASKRKADPHFQSPSAVYKKQARSFDELDNPSLDVTPKRKGMLGSGTEKITSGHVRRKSICALLRRKNRKRGKSTYLTPEASELKKKSDDRCLVKHENVSSNGDESKSPNEKSSCLSTELKTNTQSGSIKKSMSDCYLTKTSNEFSMLPVFTVTSSQGCLTHPLKTSSYNLRSGIESKSLFDEAIFSNKNVNKVRFERQQKNALEETTGKKLCVKIETDEKNLISHDNNMHDRINSYTNYQRSEDQSKINKENCSETIKEFSNSIRKSPRLVSFDDTAVTGNNDNKDDRNEVIFSIKSVSSSLNSENVCLKEETIHPLSLKRQDAFVIRSMKKNSKNSSSTVKNLDSSELNCKDKILKKDSFKLQNSIKARNDNRRNKSVRKSLRNKTRHGSLIRGRPNSVTSGLSSEFSHHSTTISDSALSSSTHNNSNNALVLKPDESSRFEGSRSQSLDLSLSILLENFCIFSPKDSLQFSLNKNDLNAMMNVSHNNEINKEKSPLTKFECKTPLRKSRKKSSSTPKNNTFEAENQEPKKYMSVCIGKQDHKHKISKNKKTIAEAQTELKVEESSSSKENHSPCLTTEKVNLDNCFKTPNNKLNSPVSPTWTSGSKFFNTITSPQDEIINKRESIAMILKNNTGHVQAKVNLYDKPKNSGHNSEKKYFTQNDIAVRSTSQKCYSDNKRKVFNYKSYDLETRGSSAKNRSKFQSSPLPPIPKFTLTDLNTPSPKRTQPLKEVTNFNFGIEDFKTGESPCKTLNFDSPIETITCANKPLQMTKITPNSKSKLKKTNRNSFSGHTPYKIAKKVSRSESSPACGRKKNILHE